MPGTKWILFQHHVLSLKGRWVDYICNTGLPQDSSHSLPHLSCQHSPATWPLFTLLYTTFLASLMYFQTHSCLVEIKKTTVWVARTSLVYSLPKTQGCEDLLNMVEGKFIIFAGFHYVCLFPPYFSSLTWL